VLHPPERLCVPQFVVRKGEKVSVEPNKEEHKNFPRRSVWKSTVAFEITIRGEVKGDNRATNSNSSTFQHMKYFIPDKFNRGVFGVAFSLPLFKSRVHVELVEYSS